MESRKERHQRKGTIDAGKSYRKWIGVSAAVLIAVVLIIWQLSAQDSKPEQAASQPTASNAVSPSSLPSASPTITPAQETAKEPSEQEKAEIAKEQERLAAVEQESGYFGDAEKAAKIMQAEWALIPQTVNPGDVLLVRHRQAGNVTWQGKSYTLEKFETGYYTYIPIPILMKSGQYPIGDLTLTVQSKTFPEDRLEVSKELESIKQNTEQIAKDQKKINEARSHSAATFLFPPDSEFIQPVEGRLSTPFGYTRYVNGKYDGSHTAIDLAAPEGTPIKATNDGVVVLAENLYLTGNSVYMDHGMMLFSQYIHMSELKVKTGDEVKKGDIIGLVGQTGFATGPHLHFTFWAHGVPVNPNLFFGKTPFQW